MSNSRGYVSYQAVENAYSCVPYIIYLWENKEKDTPRKTSIQVTETIKFVKAINTCQNHQNYGIMGK